MPNENIFYHLLLIEWDGGKPPTRWYNRLARLGLTSRRGEKQANHDKSPLLRRLEKNGVVAQEGALFVSSESLARTLGQEARLMGARSVMLTQAKIKEIVDASPQDKKAHQMMEKEFGTRGRPSKTKPQVFYVICHEEKVIHKTDGEVFRCPVCGSNYIETVGEKAMPVLKPDLSKGLVSAWQGMRIATGRFLINLTSDTGIQAVSIPPTASNPAKAAIEFFYNNKLLSLEECLRCLDFMEEESDERARVGLEKVNENRIKAITYYFQEGGDDSGISIAPTSLIDVFDVAGIILKNSNNWNLYKKLVKASVKFYSQEVK
jgi:hypothetical protein